MTIAIPHAAPDQSTRRLVEEDIIRVDQDPVIHEPQLHPIPTAQTIPEQRAASPIPSVHTASDDAKSEDADAQSTLAAISFPLFLFFFQQQY